LLGAFGVKFSVKISYTIYYRRNPALLLVMLSERAAANDQAG
jgi:hypothetical protein